MEKEILLTGGRVTQGVVRIGNHVHRPQCSNAGFVHSVLEHLAKKNISFAPETALAVSATTTASFLPISFETALIFFMASTPSISGII